MKSKVFGRVISVGAAALCTALVVTSSLAATTQWQQWRINSYGYSGGYTELASANGLNAGNREWMPLVAVPGKYSVSGGTITVNNSTDIVYDELQYDQDTVDAIWYLRSLGEISPSSGLFEWSRNALSQQAQMSHVSLQVQTWLLCPNEGWTSGPTSGTAADVHLVYAEVDIYYCPEGGLPYSAQAEFWHGIKY